MTFGFRAFSWNAIDASGRDASTWLGGIVTCDLPARSADGARWGLLLSKQGKIQAELVVTSVGADGLSMAVRGGDASNLRNVLDHHLVMEDVELGPVRAQPWGILVGTTDADVGRLSEAGLDVCSAPAPFGVAGSALVRSQGTYEELVLALSALGVELAEGAWDDARVTMGLPAFGVDYDDSDNPHQASLERRAVSWQKGCYLGQEVVFMQDARGKVKRRLVRLSSAEQGPLTVGASVTSLGGEEVGTITTAGQGQALARVHAPHFEPGSSLLVGALPVTSQALDAGLFGRGRVD